MLLLDITLATGDAFSHIAEFRRKKPGLKVVMLTMHRDWNFVQQASNAGAEGYVLKDKKPLAIVADLRRVMAGHRVFPEGTPAARAPVFHTAELELLSPREREVLDGVGRGLRSKEIAEELDVSIRTIEAHRASIIEKLKLKGAADLVKFAVRLNPRQ